MSDKQIAQLVSQFAHLRSDLQAYHDFVRNHVETQMASFDDLKREVRESRDTVDAVLNFVSGLKSQLAAALAQNDPAAIQEIVDELDAQQAKIAEAVAQTPAAPSQPPPVEAPVEAPSEPAPPADPGSEPQPG